MKKLIQTIFSSKREKKHRVITILGVKLKFKKEKRIKQIDMIKGLQTQVRTLQSHVNNVNHKLNLFFDFYLDARQAKTATGGLRQRQLDNTELLREFVRICNKHNINYWLDYGSLLGAVRHGGFVPWDDDLDVSMTHEDIEKFRSVVETELNSKYTYTHILTCYNRLTFTNDNGAFLDIYEYSNKDGKYRIGEKNPGFKADFFSTPEEILYPLKTISFEGLEVKCPNNIDTYLRIKYGNYELLPKWSHNVPGHSAIEEYKIYYPEELKRCKK